MTTTMTANDHNNVRPLMTTECKIIASVLTANCFVFCFYPAVPCHSGLLVTVLPRPHTDREIGVSTWSSSDRAKPKTLKVVPVRNARELARQSQDNVWIGCR